MSGYSVEALSRSTLGAERPRPQSLFQRHPIPSPLPVRIGELERSNENQWDAYVDAHPHGTLFHTLAWRNAVQYSFGHKAIYLAAFRDQFVGVLPLFLVPDFPFGRILVSVPYAVGGGILANEPEVTAALLATALERAREFRCRRIELRSEHGALPDRPVVDRYVGFRRELPEIRDEVLPWLPRKARAVVRRAIERRQLEIAFEDGFLADVWRLYARNMRRLASIAYPFCFFRALAEQTPRAHWVSVATLGGTPVAGLLTFLHRDRVIPYFFGSTESARRCGAANLLYFRLMQRAVVEGFRVFDFGRTRRENLGSLNFKRFQGFEPRPLGYQAVALGDEPSEMLSPDHRLLKPIRALWPRLPFFVTNALSALVAPRIPG